MNRINPTQRLLYSPGVLNDNVLEYRPHEIEAATILRGSEGCLQQGFGRLLHKPRSLTKEGGEGVCSLTVGGLEASELVLPVGHI